MFDVNGSPRIPDPWLDDALCARSSHPEWWFQPDESALAEQTCARCRVRGECLQYAIEHGIDDGIWVVSPRERGANLHGGDGAWLSRRPPSITRAIVRTGPVQRGS